MLPLLNDKTWLDNNKQATTGGNTLSSLRHQYMNRTKDTIEDEPLSQPFQNSSRTILGEDIALQKAPASKAYQPPGTAAHPTTSPVQRKRRIRASTPSQKIESSLASSTEFIILSSLSLSMPSRSPLFFFFFFYLPESLHVRVCEDKAHFQLLAFVSSWLYTLSTRMKCLFNFHRYSCSPSMPRECQKLMTTCPAKCRCK